MMRSRFRLMSTAGSHSRLFIYTRSGRKAGKELRLAALFHGLTAQPDVLALFGRPAIRTRLRGYEVWYYEIRVHNPFEEYPDVRG